MTLLGGLLDDNYPAATQAAVHEGLAAAAAAPVTVQEAFAFLRTLGVATLEGMAPVSAGPTSAFAALGSVTRGLSEVYEALAVVAMQGELVAEAARAEVSAQAVSYEVAASLLGTLVTTHEALRGLAAQGAMADEADGTGVFVSGAVQAAHEGLLGAVRSLVLVLEAHAVVAAAPAVTHQSLLPATASAVVVLEAGAGALRALMATLEADARPATALAVVHEAMAIVVATRTVAVEACAPRQGSAAVVFETLRVVLRQAGVTLQAIGTLARLLGFTHEALAAPVLPVEGVLVSNETLEFARVVAEVLQLAGLADEQLHVGGPAE